MDRISGRLSCHFHGPKDGSVKPAGPSTVAVSMFPSFVRASCLPFHVTDATDGAKMVID